MRKMRTGEPRLHGIELVDASDSHAAAARAVALAREVRVDALMKGALHTNELMSAVVDREAGLRTERRISHVFAFDVPTYPKPLLITDAAINIYPDLRRNATSSAMPSILHTPSASVCPRWRSSRRWRLSIQR